MEVSVNVCKQCWKRKCKGDEQIALGKYHCGLCNDTFCGECMSDVSDDDYHDFLKTILELGKPSDYGNFCEKCSTLLDKKEDTILKHLPCVEKCCDEIKKELKRRNVILSKLKKNDVEDDVGSEEEEDDEKLLYDEEDEDADN